METKLTKKDLSDDLIGFMVVVADETSRHYRTAGRVAFIYGEYVCFHTEHLSHREHYSALDRISDDPVPVALTGTWTCASCGELAKEGHVCLKTQWVKFKDEQPPKGKPILLKLDGEDVYTSVLKIDRFKHPSALFSHWHIITAPE